MLKEEYIQLAKELKGDLLLELVKRFFLFKYYCCPVKLKRAKKSCPKPYKFRLRVFFSPK